MLLFEQKLVFEPIRTCYKSKIAVSAVAVPKCKVLPKGALYCCFPAMRFLAHPCLSLISVVMLV